MQLTEIKNVATFINGFPFKPEHWEPTGKKIIRIQNLTDIKKSYNLTTFEVPERYIVRRGDILVSWSATIDVFEWDDSDAYLNQHIFKVVFDETKVAKSYFKIALKKTINDLVKFAHGSTMKHIVKGDFENHQIPLPPLPEQIAIANLLSKAEALIAKRKESLVLLDAYLKGTFLEMFGDPVRNEKGWDRVTIRDLVSEVKYGTSKSADGGKYKYLRMNNITSEGYWDFTNIKTISVEETEKEKYALKRNDIVFNRTNSKELVGKTAVA